MYRALPLLLLLLCADARAEVVPCAGAPIVAVEIAGCDQGTCKARPALDRLVQTLPLTRADATPLAEADLIRLAGIMKESKLVAAVPTFACRDDQTLVVKVQPQAFVRKVSLAGNDHFRKKDLMKRVFLRSGTPLTLDPSEPKKNDDVARQVDSLLRLYRQAGLDAAQIEVHARLVSQTELDLELVIAEGPRTRIDTVVATHVRRNADDKSRQRCPTITDRRLERRTGLETGDVVTRLTERQVKDRIRKAFQAAGYVRPDILVAPAPDEPGRLEVVVETAHCWVVRVWERDLPSAATSSELSFQWTDPLHAPTGDRRADYRRAELEEWEDVLPFGESGAFDRDEATRGVDAVVREIRARGYPFAEVQLVHRELPRVIDEPGVPNIGEREVVGIIDYLITLNLPRRIAAIRFEGNHSVEADVLAELMKSRSYDFFGSPGAFDQAKAFADLVVLRRYYLERGWLGMRFVDRAEPSEEPAILQRELLSDLPDAVIWRYTAGDLGFRMEKTKSDLDLTLVIGIDEGPQTRVHQLDVTGATLLTPAQVAERTELGANRPFGSKPLADGLEKLRRFYQKRGHHRLEVQVTCRLRGASEPSSCDADQLAGKGDVDLTMVITEGPPIHVGAVVWRGNSETDPHVLVRDLPKRGEILDIDAVNLAVRRMRSLGIYNSVRVDIIGLEDPLLSATSNEVTLVVSVEETNYRFLDVAAGLRSIQRANIGKVPRWAADGAGLLVDQADRLSTGFGRAFALDIPDILMTLEVEYLDLDISGLGHQLRVPFTVGFSLSQFLRLATFNPGLTFPRLFDSTVTLTTRVVAEMDAVTDPLDRLEIGAEADATVPLSDTMLAGVTVRAGVIQLSDPEDDCVYCLKGPPLGWSTNLPQDMADEAASEVACGPDDGDDCTDLEFRPQFTLALRWRWDRQDTPLHPSKGIVLSAGTSFILDRDRDLATVKFNQFVKWETSVRGAISFGPVILAGFARYGGAATFGERFLPADERYSLGGSNGMRGFADNGVCRYDESGRVMDDCGEEFGGNVVVNGSLELRVPLLESAGLWLGTFIDIGALAETHDELRPESVRFGAGLGFRFLLGGLFPIRLDFGFPVFERRCIRYLEDTNECVLEDASQIHFDLLYSF